MEIKGNPNPAELIGAAESVGSNTGHCKRRLSTESSNPDTEASGSCNFEPVKRPRKVLKKMARPSHKLSRAEMHTLNQEEPETQHLAMIDANLSPLDIKALLEEAAKVVNATYMSAKCDANYCFSVLECEIIAKELSCKHKIFMPYNLVKKNLESLYFSFKDYCGVMKSGKTGLSFYWETGYVSTHNGLYEMHDPILIKTCVQYDEYLRESLSLLLTLLLISCDLHQTTTTCGLPPSRAAASPVSTTTCCLHMELQMEPYEIVCKCEKGRMLCKLSNSVKNRNKMYYCCPKTKKTTKNGIWEWGCASFLWEHELTRCPCGEGLCAHVPREDKGMTLYRCSRQGCSPPGSEEGKASSKSITCESSGGFASGEGSSSRRCQRCPLIHQKQDFGSQAGDCSISREAC